jgi:hypothetical protein
MVIGENSRPASAEQQLRERGIKLPTPVELEIIFEVAGG